MVKNRKDKKRRECTNFVGRGEGSVYKKKSFKLAETYKIIYILYEFLILIPRKIYDFTNDILVNISPYRAEITFVF